MKKAALNTARRALLLAVGACCMAGVALPVAADDFPSQPIELIVGYPPGSSSDAMARILAKPLSDALGVPVVVQHRPGASGSLGAAYVARAKPNGYSVYYGLPDALIVAPLLRPEVPYRIEKDFTALAKVVDLSLVLVSNSNAKITSVTDLLSQANHKPGELKYSSPGIGSVHQLAAELMMQETGSKFLHVPYQGGGPALMGLIRGDADFMFGSQSLVASQIGAGTVTPLAVTSKARLPALPDVPTMEESNLKGLELTTWYGIFGPANIPEPVANKLSNAIMAVISSPDYQEKIAALGAQVDPMGKPAFAKFLQGQSTMYANIIKRGNIKLEN